VKMTKLVNLCSSCSLHANSTALSCYTISTDNTNESMIPMGGANGGYPADFYSTNLILHLFNSHFVLFFLVIQI
jgi:hypothetical protein